MGLTRSLKDQKVAEVQKIKKFLNFEKIFFGRIGTTRTMRKSTIVPHYLLLDKSAPGI